MKPEFTIVIPTRGLKSPFLDRAIFSVLNQTSPEWRLVVLLDDGDIDESDYLGFEDARADCRVRFVTFGGRGLTPALNYAMSLVETPFMCSLHDDDELSPEACEVVNRAIRENPEADYFHSARRFIDEEGRFLTAVLPPKEGFTERDFLQSGQPKQLHVWRVSAALAIGGMDESFKLHGGDDFDFPWSMLEAGFRFFPVKECLYYIRDHRSAPRLTTHVPLATQIEELRRIFHKHGVDEETIEKQLKHRTTGYLQQALFRDEEDKTKKLRSPDFDPRDGWREIPKFDDRAKDSSRQ